MTEQTTPEKKQKNNKALYWCLAIGAIGALCLPQEIQIGIFALDGTVIITAGIIGFARLRKKIDPQIKAADNATKEWKREVRRATNYANASLEHGTRAIHAKSVDENEDASHYEERFAEEARRTYVKLESSPRKLNDLMDRLPEASR